jgi:hypothetical protein
MTHQEKAFRDIFGHTVTLGIWFRKDVLIIEALRLGGRKRISPKCSFVYVPIVVQSLLAGIRGRARLSKSQVYPYDSFS